MHCSLKYTTKFITLHSEVCHRGVRLMALVPITSSIIPVL